MTNHTAYVKLTHAMRYLDTLAHREGMGFILDDPNRQATERAWWILHDARRKLAPMIVRRKLEP